MLSLIQCQRLPEIMQFSISEVCGNPLVSPQVESYRGNVNPIGIRSCQCGQFGVLVGRVYHIWDIFICGILGHYHKWLINEKKFKFPLDCFRHIQYYSICACESKPLTRQNARVAQRWSTSLPRRGSRVRFPSRALEKRRYQMVSSFSSFNYKLEGSIFTPKKSQCLIP